MIGYDFNGVADSGRFRIYPDDVIITGNTYHIGVLEKLKELEIKARVYFPPDNRIGNNANASAVWKCEMIRRIGVTQFYENDLTQYRIIKDSCPDCEVIKV